MEIKPRLEINKPKTYKVPIEQTGIKGENVEIKANNVYIVNNNYNEPVYNNYQNRFYNPSFFNYSIQPNLDFFNHYYYIIFPYFWCYSLPFIPWTTIFFPYIWGW